MGETSGFAIAALILGIVSVLVGWIPFFGLVPIILAIIFGIIALTKVNKKKVQGKGMAIAGLIMGGVMLIVSIIIFFVAGVAILGVFNEIEENGKCFIEPDLSILDCAFEDGVVVVSLHNGMDIDLSETLVTFESASCSHSLTEPSTIAENATVQYTFPCDAPEGLFSAGFNVSFTSPSGLTDKNEGFLIFVVKEEN